jgi:hypothetical protein
MIRFVHTHSTARLVGVSALLAIVAGLTGNMAQARGGGGGGGHMGGGGHSGGHGGGHYGGGIGHYGGTGHYGYHGSAGFGRIPGSISYHSASWSPHAYWHNWNRCSGLWGGWARPWHWSNWYWGWSGIYSPLYLGSLTSGYTMGAMPNPAIGPDLYLNESDATPAEDETPSSPPRHYRYSPDQAEVLVNLASPTGTTPNKDTAHTPVRDVVSALRLGPDADITSDGKVVIYLTPDAYLLLTPKATQFIDQESGAPLLSLHPDAFLNWQVAWEIKRQLLIAQMQLHNQEANADPSNEDKTALQRAQDKVDLLTRAAAGLGTSVADSPPATSPPPVPHSVEILSSIWLTPHGKFVALKLYDDSLIYMDQENSYSDEGKTKLAMVYPTTVKIVLAEYVTGLINDAGKMREALTDAKFATEDRIMALREEADMQFAVDAADAARAAEQKKNIKLAITKMEAELKSIDQQLQSMPAEVSAANKLVSAWR